MSLVERTNFEAIISSIKDKELQEVLDLLKKAKGLEAALKSAQVFHENAIKFARMECEALLRVVELGGINSLRGNQRNTAEWLSGLPSLERTRFIGMCEEGLTIEQIWKREVGSEQKLSKTFDDLKRQREWLVDDLREQGFCDITEYNKSVRESLRRANREELQEDVIDGARNAIRKAGAVGCGDGLYVLPVRKHTSVETTKKLEDAIRVRYRSIIDDVENLVSIIKNTGLQLSYTALTDDQLAFWNNAVEVAILIGLATKGVLIDGGDLTARIAKADVAKEISAFKKSLGISREQYIDIQYHNIHGTGA